jgi:hypothetical protein
VTPREDFHPSPFPREEKSHSLSIPTTPTTQPNPNRISKSAKRREKDLQQEVLCTHARTENKKQIKNKQESPEWKKGPETNNTVS